MKLARRSVQSAKVACLLLLGAPLGCQLGSQGEGTWDANIDIDPVPECNKDIVIASDSAALLINDPAVLAKLPLDEVLSQLLSRWQDNQTTPLELLQRTFDTSNDSQGGVFADEVHCDSYENGAHANGPAALCPRSEGALALSQGMLTPGDPDHFYPVAVVNRFDLMPLSALTCGEYRIIYAKTSGLTDPNNRVFIIFEGVVPNPEVGTGDILGCRPVAEFWKGLADEKDPEKQGEAIHTFFFQGLKGFQPVIDPINLGFGTFGGASYYGTGGQIRVSQHMDEHWELRQLVMSTSADSLLRLQPMPVGNNPMPGLFAAYESGDISPTNATFAESFVYSSLQSLAGADVPHVRMSAAFEDLSGESALGGEAVNDYAARAAGNTYLHDLINSEMDYLGVGEDCPSDDPLTSDSIVRRATMESCAGCHAPAQFLGEDRKIGCGLSWPDSLGEVHIDEKGNLSPALKEVFLPHRAQVLTTYLQACDADAIYQNMGAPPGSTTKSLNMRRTLGGSTTH